MENHQDKKYHQEKHSRTQPTSHPIPPLSKLQFRQRKLQQPKRITAQCARMRTQ